MNTPSPITLTAYEHVGVRISDMARAIRFYELFGLRVVAEHPESKSRAVEMANEFGVRIHLICNGHEQPGANNVLQDNEHGYPGFTHAAFVVPDLKQVADALTRAGIAVTEGPTFEPRRTYLFCRDPDGNVLELNELSASHG
jgi:catechol 2,3-dioxygenase-like lactoylglutathione lyase family enzyme